MTEYAPAGDLAPLDFSPMFQPLQVRNVRFKNRFVMPGMGRGWNEDGRPLPELTDYYCRRVEGGTALIITEGVAVDHPTATQVPHYAWVTDATKDAWASCAAAVKAEGGELFLQLFHEGAIRAEGGDGPYAAYPTVSPSGLAHAKRPAGRALRTEELGEIRDGYVRSALIAQSIGASGVEVHSAHGYFLDQFLWAETNRRTDGYGGDDIRDRVRFPAEIVAAIRDAVGPDFVISFRFSQWKEVNYEAKITPTPADLETMIGILDKAGVDLFHASVRRFWIPEWPGSEWSLAGWVKSFTDKPVIAVGSVGFDLDVMESLLTGTEANFTGYSGFQELVRRFNDGQFDMVSIGRGQIGDARFVEKLREGRWMDIRPFTRADVRNRESRREIGSGAPSIILEAHPESTG